MEVQSEVQAAMIAKFGQNVDEILVNIDKLEQRMNEIQQFYLSTSKNASKASAKRRRRDTSCREDVTAMRMQDLMDQFAEILHHHNIGHKWARPFMQPVDVVGLGLHDYYEVIEKPMDFSTIEKKMEAKDGTGYKNVREICADVRLIFKNAMKCNDERSDVHVMAKTLLVKFQEMWLQFLPKVIEEDERQKKEETKAQIDMQLAKEIDNAKMARELSIELHEIDLQLEKLREVVLGNCRKMIIQDKVALMNVLTQLSPEDLEKALLIVAQNDPDFDTTSKKVELLMNAQSESTLWKLKFFVKDILKGREKASPSIKAIKNLENSHGKREREICDGVVERKNRKPLPFF